MAQREKIKLPTKPLPERTPDEKAEYREQRELRVIEKNMQMALVAVKIEHLMSGHEPADMSDPQMRAALENLPFDWQEQFRGMIREYFLVRQEAEAAEVEILYRSGASYAGTEEEKAVLAGRWLFRNITREEPKGKIIFQRKEGYLILHYDEEDDYFVAAVGREEKTDLIKKTKEGGSYHPELIMQGGPPWYVPIIMIKGKEQSTQQLVIHERQHFINQRVTNLFSEIEPKRAVKAGSEKAGAVKQAFERKLNLRLIKDEILAYIRDGRSGKETKKVLSEPLYTHRFEPLEQDDQKMAEEVIAKVAEFIDRLNPDDRQRAELVYQLHAVPLARFPRWLELIEKYYLRAGRALTSNIETL